MRGIATFTFGGTGHNIPVPLAVVEQIEAETGRGALALMRDIVTREATITNVVTILVVALNSASKTRVYARADVEGMIAADGVLSAYVAAGKVLGALFDSPAGADKGAAKSPKGKALQS